MSTVRTRSRLLGYSQPGKFKTWFDPNGSRAYLKGQEYCQDIVGNYMGENPFTHEIVKHDPCLMNGTTGPNPWDFDIIDCPVEWNSVILHDSPPPSFSFRDATQAIAAGHPGEPPLSIPNFLYELKDLPGMLRHAVSRARTLHELWKSRGWRINHARLASYYSIRRAGEDWLNYHFGWAPFFSDMESIFGVDEYLAKRARRFKSIRNSEIRTSGTLGSYETTSTREVSLNSWMIGVSGIEQQTTVGNQWYAAKWSVNPMRYSAILDPGSKQYYRDLSGSDDIPLIIWNAIPWSWLVDWFANVDSLISLAGNRQGCQFKSAVIMTRTRSEKSVFATAKPSWLTVSKGTHIRDTKLRTLFTPTFLRQDAGFNIFQPSQLATLASLKVTRR